MCRFCLLSRITFYSLTNGEQMFYNAPMDALIKLQDIAVHMDLEPAEEVSYRPAPLLPNQTSTPKVAPCGQVTTPSPADQSSKFGITHATVSGGKPIKLLKTMLTTACERDCYYCPFRAGRSYRRQTFSPDELAKVTTDMHRAGAIDGIFLSSGIIKGGVTTQDKLIATAEILRRKYQYRGYLHLKVMPGAEKEQLEELMKYADRLSVNLEAPNDKRLVALAPKKEFLRELLQPLKWIDEIRREKPAHLGWNGRWPSSVTQFVVGGTDETDLELLTTTEYLHKQLHLRRVYFSAFRPIVDTPLEKRQAENPIRQHRLYQTAFLFRDYGFDLEELPFTQQGNLPLDEDPKLAWAKANLRENPVELNRAAPEELLRVPGIGPKGAQTIVAARRHNRLREIDDLQKAGVSTKRMKPFVLLDGKRPSYQLPLFED